MPLLRKEFIRNFVDSKWNLLLSAIIECTHSTVKKSFNYKTVICFQCNCSLKLKPLKIPLQIVKPNSILSFIITCKCILIQNDATFQIDTNGLMKSFVLAIIEN
jgi:hypothetical protein